MVNRILLSAAITLALTFSPNLAFSVPTKTVKKKSTKSSEKSPEKVTKKCKSSKSSKTYRTRSSRSRSEGVVESSMVPSYSDRHAVTETPPLMKVTPQRDGKFVLEPLTPKKTLSPPITSRPSKRPRTIASLRPLPNIIPLNPGISPS